VYIPVGNTVYMTGSS